MMLIALYTKIGASREQHIARYLVVCTPARKHIIVYITFLPQCGAARKKHIVFYFMLVCKRNVFNWSIHQTGAAVSKPSHTPAIYTLMLLRFMHQYGAAREQHFVLYCVSCKPTSLMYRVKCTNVLANIDQSAYTSIKVFTRIDQSTDTYRSKCWHMSINMLTHIGQSADKYWSKGLHKSLPTIFQQFSPNISNIY